MLEIRKVAVIGAGTAGLADPVLAAAERDYEAAANALLEALQQRRARLQPEDLAAVVTERLAGVDGIRDTYTMVAFAMYSQHDLEAMFSIGA